MLRSAKRINLSLIDGVFVGLSARFAILAACFLLSVPMGARPSHADGIVSKVISAPVFPNGTVRDIRSGLNIYLQTDAAPGDFFLDPEVIGYGLPPGGQMEVEMVSGFQRDPAVPLDGRSILLVAGTPQQALPAPQSGFTISEGDNQNTFVIKPILDDGVDPNVLLSSAPGARQDPIPQRGIKIIHVGRTSAFVSRGERGRVAVRIKDRSGSVLVRGTAEIEFLQQPVPQVFPTNIPHGQRNHNWQRVGVKQVLGVAKNTLPLPVIVYERNEGLGTNGMEGVGMLSRQQLDAVGYSWPAALAKYNGGLIFKDVDGDGFLDINSDQVVGGVQIEAPTGAAGYQVLTPIVSDKPFLSVHTSRYNERAGSQIGGAIMQVVFIAGDRPGLYRVGFAFLKEPDNIETARDPEFHYSVLVQ